MAWLVAGLGNPGEPYANTRHNVGRMVVEELARAAGERFRKARFLPAEVAEVHEAGERVLLVRSTLYMNESGTSYAGVARKQGVAAEHVIAVHDEIEIAPGELRVKFGGGTAGHNGLRSLRSALRTADFLRVRVGVGRPPGRRDPSDFVLAPIAKRDEADVAIWVDRAADAVRSLIADGLATTQDRFNRSAPGRGERRP
jgi:PTH1 family peptidyl-tRNA hydrolase